MTKQDWLHTAETLLISRLIDIIEEQELAPKGLVLYQFSARGHELAQIIMAQYLNNPHDAATVYYRSRPFVLAAGMTIEEAFAGPLANSGSLNGGRDIGVVHNLPLEKVLQYYLQVVMLALNIHLQLVGPKLQYIDLAF